MTTRHEPQSGEQFIPSPRGVRGRGLALKPEAPSPRTRCARVGPLPAGQRGRSSRFARVEDLRVLDQNVV